MEVVVKCSLTWRGLLCKSWEERLLLEKAAAKEYLKACCSQQSFSDFPALARALYHFKLQLLKQERQQLWEDYILRELLTREMVVLKKRYYTVRAQEKLKTCYEYIPTLLRLTQQQLGQLRPQQLLAECGLLQVDRLLSPKELELLVRYGCRCTRRFFGLMHCKLQELRSWRVPEAIVRRKGIACGELYGTGAVRYQLLNLNCIELELPRNPAVAAGNVEFAEAAEFPRWPLSRRKRGLGSAAGYKQPEQPQLQAAEAALLEQYGK